MESTIHRFVCSAGIAILLAGCAYDGMYTRFLIPRISVTEDQAAVSDIMYDVLKPFGFSQTRSPAPGRAVDLTVKMVARFTKSRIFSNLSVQKTIEWE